MQTRLRGRRNGFVLMAALWLLVALSAVGIDAALRHRARRAAAANLLDSTRLRAASSAGAEYARSRLTSAMLGRADELRAEAARAASQRTGARVTVQGGNLRNMFRASDPANDPWRDPSGLVPASLEWNGVTTTLMLRDPGAALNINGSDEDMLRQFFSLGLGLDYKLATELTAAILDFRDDDDLPRLNGGEREEYMHDGLPVLPANHAFSQIDELRFVKGMNDEIFALARPYLRATTGGSTININAAPQQVLLALPGMTPEGATALLRARRNGFFPRTPAELATILPRATSQGITAAGAAFTRRVIYSTDQVEVIAQSSIPANPVHATTQIIVDRALNGAAVTWRRVE